MSRFLALLVLTLSFGVYAHEGSKHPTEESREVAGKKASKEDTDKVDEDREAEKRRKKERRDHERYLRQIDRSR